MVCAGGDKICPKAKYSRLNDDTDQFLQCPLPASCLGSDSECTSLLGECK